jgi:hypothetical protein
VFRIGGNTFYDRKNKILMKIPESKRSEIGIIAEFRRIPNGIPNLGGGHVQSWMPLPPGAAGDSICSMENLWTKKWLLHFQSNGRI